MTKSPPSFAPLSLLLLLAFLQCIYCDVAESSSSSSSTSTKDARETSKPSLLKSNMVSIAITIIGAIIIITKWNGPKVDAKASHILVKTKAEAEALKKVISNDDKMFEKMAKEKSQCPSGKAAGGSLGRFGKGQMVPPFERVIFDPDNKIGVVYGPIETQFGWHLILINERRGVEKK